MLTTSSRHHVVAFDNWVVPKRLLQPTWDISVVVGMIWLLEELSMPLPQLRLLLVCFHFFPNGVAAVLCGDATKTAV
jgi:hypothetical protein